MVATHVRLVRFQHGTLHLVYCYTEYFTNHLDFSSKSLYNVF